MGLLDRISLSLPFPSIIYTQDEVSFFQSRQVALHHPPLAEYIALTHMHAFIINTSSGPVHRLAYQKLKEIVQSNLKWPGGNFHNHVPISPTVNNGNAKGHCVQGEWRGGRHHQAYARCSLLMDVTLTRSIWSDTHTHIVGRECG